MSDCCYLLHFSKPYKHAKHYLGTTQDLLARLQLHDAGKGARLTQVVREAGIDLQLVRTWPGNRTLELKLKRQHNSPRLCPICNPPQEPEIPEIPW
jgi:predicted GIY-YIG superfamily endonuclease